MPPPNAVNFYRVASLFCFFPLNIYIPESHNLITECTEVYELPDTHRTNNIFVHFLIMLWHEAQLHVYSEINCSTTKISGSCVFSLSPYNGIGRYFPENLPTNTQRPKAI